MPAHAIPYTFSATPWQYTGAGGWVFISLPMDIAQEIRKLFGNEEQGWGRLQVTAQIGDTNWETAIWWDTKHNTYLLPLKADVRKKEGIQTDREIKVIIFI